MNRVANEVAFGLENTGVEPSEIWPRVEEALASVGAAHLAERPVSELRAASWSASASRRRSRSVHGCCCSTSRRRSSTRTAAESFFDLVERLPCAVLVSEQRPARPLARADRVLFMDGGRIMLDAPRDEAIAWLAASTGRSTFRTRRRSSARVARRRFAYGDNVVLDGASLSAPRRDRRADRPERRGQDDAAQIAAGLLAPDSGTVEARGAPPS